ncbi:MAG: hypothetical protein Q4C73_02985 [Eubacteriales bacterium]|nr:hypothetical protein [Eubacteriales bacterium]
MRSNRLSCIVVIIPKELSSDCADWRLASKDAQAFDSQDGMNNLERVLSMNISDLKKLISSYSSICSQIQLLRLFEAANSSSAKQSVHVSSLELKLYMIRACLSILSPEERFIIQNHLINQLTWEQTIHIYETIYGTANGKSERTLKRIQKNALNKISCFLNQPCFKDIIDSLCLPTEPYT